MTDPTLVFPNNIIEALNPSLAALDGVKALRARPARVSDPDGFCGVFPVQWQPGEIEIGPMADPQFSRYQITIQVLTKSVDADLGRATNAALSKSIRAMLYRDADLRLRLGGMHEISPDGAKEALQRWGVLRQRFASNELQGQYVYLSSTDLWAETDINGGF